MFFFTAGSLFLSQLFHKYSLIRLYAVVKTLHKEELSMDWLHISWKICMSECTCTCMHTYMNLLQKPRGLAGVEKQNEDKPVPRSLCVY